MGSMLEFSVVGCPMPQGSKVAMVRAGRAFMTESANMQTKTRKSGALDRWRAAVTTKAIKTMTGELWLGPVELQCEFVMPRSPSHYTSKGALTKAAPTFPVKYDLSKLMRAVEDALTGIVYKDDSQVVSYGESTAKRYAGALEDLGGVHVKVREL